MTPPSKPATKCVDCLRLPSIATLIAMIALIDAKQAREQVRLMSTDYL
jgi:hypothetical protein